MTESNQLVLRVACVAVTLCVVFPLGQIVFYEVANVIGELPFNAIEAVVTATLGFGLFEVLFG
ncbi:MAG: hypothetical protein GEU91_00270 [Rhizobiales bacterium]|nr:hypothetical protein [Hyphomicrobiales bacterium]